MERHRASGAAITVLTTLLEDPVGYGRIVKDKEGNVLGIVEHRDATDEQRKIREINTGIYCAENPFLFEAVSEIGNDNAQKEYYFTDIFAIARRKGVRTASVVAPDPGEVMGINSPEDLHQLARGSRPGDTDRAGSAEGEAEGRAVIIFQARGTSLEMECCAPNEF